MWWKHHDLLQYTVPSTQGSFSYLHIHRSLLRGRIMTICVVVFTIINFKFDFIFLFSHYWWLYTSLSILCIFPTIFTASLSCFFPFLLALMTHKWTCISWFQLWLCLLSIYETGITIVTSNTILLYVLRGRVGIVSKSNADPSKTFEQRNVDWLLQDTAWTSQF